MYGEGGYGGGRPRGGFGGGGAAPVSVGEELDVKIEAVGEKGDGIARKRGFVLFVPNTREGDEVRIRVTKVLRKVGFADVIGQAQGTPAAEEEHEAPAAPEPEPEPEPSPEDTEDFGEEPAEEPAAPEPEAPAEEPEAPEEEPEAEEPEVPPMPGEPEPEAPAEEPEGEEEKKEE
jgi:predicted RNA-binding protein with TRAM domain